jgi:hypothetical protein
VLYQRKTLSTGEEVGEPGLLPVRFQGLSDAVLADLAPLGVPDTGYFPVIEPEPEPEPVRWVHKAIFKRRLTSAERIAIRAAETDENVAEENRAALKDFRDILDSTNDVFLDDPDLVEGLGFLVLLGLLGPERPAEIRA